MNGIECYYRKTIAENVNGYEIQARSYIGQPDMVYACFSLTDDSAPTTYHFTLQEARYYCQTH